MKCKHCGEEIKQKSYPSPEFTGNKLEHFWYHTTGKNCGSVLCYLSAEPNNSQLKEAERR